MEWGTTHYEEEEEERPEFKGKKVRSVINGKMTRYFSDDDRARLLFWSGVMIAPMIILVLGIVGENEIYLLSFLLCHININDWSIW
jgi:hypothetical protein